jgi:hypothetical protein
MEVFRSKYRWAARFAQSILSIVCRKTDVVIDFAPACPCEGCQRPDGEPILALVVPDEEDDTTASTGTNLPN